MKEFKIQMEDDGIIYINGHSHTCAVTLDRADPEVDQDKKIILALMDEMGYEPLYLCDEIAERLDEIFEDEFIDQLAENSEADYKDYENDEE